LKGPFQGIFRFLHEHGVFPCSTEPFRSPSSSPVLLEVWTTGVWMRTFWPLTFDFGKSKLGSFQKHTDVASWSPNLEYNSSFRLFHSLNPPYWFFFFLHTIIL
jgi:hypothetical protein